LPLLAIVLFRQHITTQQTNTREHHEIDMSTGTRMMVTLLMCTTYHKYTAIAQSQHKYKVPECIG
jgi:hypothetical protein